MTTWAIGAIPVGVSEPSHIPEFPGELPRGMTYDDRGHELEFSWRWRKPQDWFMILFSVVWNAIMVAVVAGMLTAASFEIWILAHLFVGLGTGYIGLRQLLNRTTVTLRPRELTASSGPIGRQEDVLLNPLDVKQLYIRSRESYKLNNEPVFIYELHAIVRDRWEDLLVVGNIAKLEQAMFMEARVEQYLEISDIPVPGSISRHTGRQVPETHAMRQPPPPARPQDSSEELREVLRSTPPAGEPIRPPLELDRQDRTARPIIDPDAREF